MTKGPGDLVAVQQNHSRQNKAISGIPFGLSKYDFALHGLDDENYMNRNVPYNAGLASSFSKILMISQKWIFLQNYSKNKRYFPFATF